MSYFASKLSNFTGQTDPDRLRDYLLSVDMDLANLFNASSIFHQFGTGSNYSILTYTSTNYVWFPSIGAWNITNSLLYGGAGANYIGLQPSVGIWLGDPAFANAVFSVDPVGQMKSHAGRIGGWYIGTTTLSSTNLVFDSANELIKSEDFVSGALGTGWRIDKDVAEFQNIRARGKITSSVFEKSSISSIGGNFLISDSDILNADMTASDTSTMTVLGLTTFATNDILRIKDTTNDEWFTITGSTSAYGYTVTRDMKGDYVLNTNPIWKAGTAVVNFGASGEGLIFMTASETNSPYFDVVTHAGAPWTTLTTRLRLGNLNGFLGYVTDRYGIAIGETTKYLKYDPTDGLQIKGTVTLDSNSTLSNLVVSSVVGWAASGDTTKIDGGKIYTSSIVSNSISATAITTEKIAADTITADKYNQLRNTYIFDGEDSLDTTYSFTIPFKISSEMIAIQDILLSFKILNFRAYSTEVPSGGGSTTPSGGGSTTPSGGGSTSGATSISSHNHSLYINARSDSGTQIYYSSENLYTSGGGSILVGPHTLTIQNGTTGNTVYFFNGIELYVSGGGIITTSSVSHGGLPSHSHQIFLSDGTSGTLLSWETAFTPDQFSLPIAEGTLGSAETDSFGTAHTHTTPAHTHTTPDHTHTTPDHTHTLSFGIYEEANSPTVHYHIDNGAGFLDASPNYTTSQTDLIITSSITGIGWKTIRFDTTARCRIYAVVECKVDISA